MDGAGGHTAGELCAAVWRSALGFYCESFRFEGGGRQYNRGRLFRRYTNFRRSNSFNYMKYFVVGLNRTGKSCRLRWVNYLHPGLKRGKMTPQEERLVLELHAKWGNRWSRIARKLPGRTDNEIKNYWRTHMRKKAQERKRAVASPSSSSSNCSSSSSTVTTVDSLPCPPPPPQGKASFYDTGGNDETRVAAALVEEYETGCYSMDDIWKDIELSEEKIMKQQGGNGNGNCNFACPSPMASPARWGYACWDSIWKMDEGDEESKLMINLPNDDQFISSWAATLTG